jgi:hypothetical protein
MRGEEMVQQKMQSNMEEKLDGETAEQEGWSRKEAKKAQEGKK